MKKWRFGVQHEKTVERRIGEETVRPGEIAFINHPDLDQVAAESLNQSQCSASGQRQSFDYRTVP